MNDLIDRLRNEPAIINNVAAFIVAVAAALGLDLETEAVIALAGAVLTIAAVLTRRAVTPLRRPVDADGRPLSA